MRCKSCGFENEYTEKYCFICGRALYNNLVAPDYSSNHTKTDAAGIMDSNHFTNGEQSTDAPPSFNPPIQGTDLNHMMNHLESSDGVSESIHPENDSLQPESFNPALPKPDFNHTLYFTNASPASKEIQAEPEEPKTVVNTDSIAATSPSLASEELHPVSVEQNSLEDTHPDEATEGAMGLRYSLDRLIHGNIRPAASQDALSPDIPELTNEAGNSSLETPEGAAALREENKGSISDQPEQSTISADGPVSNNEKTIDIQSLLNTIHSLSSLEYGEDDKNFSYNTPKLTNPGQDGKTEPLDDERQETVFIQPPEKKDSEAQPMFKDDHSTAVSDEAQPEREVGRDLSNNELISEADVDNEPANISDEENITFSQPETVEALPEQPIGEKPPRTIFHLNGFVIANDTTFVRPLSQSAISGMAQAGESGENETLQKEVPNPSQPVPEATDSTVVQNKPFFGRLVTSDEAEFPKTAEVTEGGVFNGSEKTPYDDGEKVERIQPVQIPPNLVQPTESDEDLSAIDYLQEASHDAWEYSENTIPDTIYGADAVPSSEEIGETESVTEEKTAATDDKDSDDFEMDEPESITVTEEPPTEANPEFVPIPQDQPDPQVSESTSRNDRVEITETASGEGMGNAGRSNDYTITAEEIEELLAKAEYLTSDQSVALSQNGSGSEMVDLMPAMEEPGINSLIDDDNIAETVLEMANIPEKPVAAGEQEKESPVYMDEIKSSSIPQNIGEPFSEPVSPGQRDISPESFATESVMDENAAENVQETADIPEKPVPTEVQEKESPVSIDGIKSSLIPQNIGEPFSEPVSPGQRDISPESFATESVMDENAVEIVQETADIPEKPVPAEVQEKESPVYIDGIKLSPIPQNIGESFTEPVSPGQRDISSESAAAEAADIKTSSSSEAVLPSYVAMEELIREMSKKESRPVLGNSPNSQISPKAGGFFTEPYVTPNGNLQEPFKADDAMTENETETAAANEFYMQQTIEPGIVTHQNEGVFEKEYRESDTYEDLSVTEFNWLWKRCAATLVDILILGLPLGFLLQRIKTNGVAFIFAFVIVYWIYSIIFETSPLQATLGKLLFRLIVTDQNGNRVGLIRASNRFFTKILSGVLLRIITEKKQCLHDVLSKTLVLGG